jgi:hypothetical protein
MDLKTKINENKIESEDIAIDPSYRPDLFDYSGGYESQPDIEIADNVSDWIRAEAIRFYNLFTIPPNNKLCGLAVGSGDVGQGKDLLFNYIDWVCNKAFTNKKILRDEKPRDIFGIYDGLFNPEVLDDTLVKMKELTKGNKIPISTRNALLDQMADEWVTENGAVMLRDSVLYLTEFWKYHDLRKPFNPMNNMLGGVHKLKRHFRILVLGTIQLITDLDKRRCLPFIDWRIICRRSQIVSTGFIGYVFKFSYNINNNRITMSNMPIDTIAVDGAKPVDEIGKPFTILKPEYKGDRYEQKLIDAIKSGVVTYADLKNEVKYKGKNKPKLVKVIKRLFMQKVIDYGCFFVIYNSQSKSTF